MQTLLGLILSLVAIWLTGSLLNQARRGKVDLFSVRNFFLVGFIVFQLTSGALTLWTGYYDALQCSDYTRTGAIFTGMALLFLLLYLGFYRWGKPATAIAARLRIRHGEAGPMTMLVLAACFLVGAIFWRLVLIQVPVLGVLASIVHVGLAAAAAGFAAWVWAPRWSNPFVAIVTVAIIGIALADCLYGAFGRRNALSVVIACLWGAHHGYWKHIGVRRASGQVGALLAGALIFLAAFTAGRKQSGTDSKLSVGESISRLAEGNLGQGFLDMATGQGAAACSMWLIETRPDGFPYDTFHSLRYFLGHPVPRIIWEGKPLALGGVMPRQARVKGRNWDTFSFGPGIIGHIANDNPWLTMVPYAFGLAFLMRFMDHLIRLHPRNPFVIVPLGVALGDVLGLARGETGQFLSRAVIIIVAVWVSMSVCAMVLGMLGLHVPRANQEPEIDDQTGASPDAGSGLIDPQLADGYGDMSDADRAA